MQKELLLIEFEPDMPAVFFPSSPPLQLRWKVSISYAAETSAIPSSCPVTANSESVHVLIGSVEPSPLLHLTIRKASTKNMM